MPPALVGALPPRLAEFSPGKTGYTRPCGRVAWSSCSSVTPDCTTPTWFTSSISMISTGVSTMSNLRPSSYVTRGSGGCAVRSARWPQRADESRRVQLCLEVGDCLVEIARVDRAEQSPQGCCARPVGGNRPDQPG